MVKKSTEYPERGERIIGTVTKVNPFSVQVMMDEYGKEGMIHVSEVARKWVKDIRDFAKVGQKVVAKVMKIDDRTGYVGLSLKRVSKREAEERMKEFKRETKAERMLETIAKENKMTLDQVYDEIGFLLQETFGEMFKAFQTALTPQGSDILKRKGIPDKWIKIITKVAEKQMEIKEMPLKVILNITCPISNGVETIKKILSEAEKKYGVSINYISAPKYSMTLLTKDAKSGEVKLAKISDGIIKKIEKAGGEGSYERE